MPRNPSKFRIAARNIFLSYPQCSLSKEEALEQIKNINYPIPLKYLRVAQVKHEDGQFYLHCLLQFAGKFQTQNRKFFDLVSPAGSTNFHPDIEGAKSRSAVKCFISEDGDFAEWEFRSDGRNKKKSVHEKLADVYSAALKKEDKAAALAIIREGDPRGFVLNFDKITRNLDLIFQKPKMNITESGWDHEAGIWVGFPETTR